MAEEYAPTYVADEKLGRFGVHHIKLTAKKNADVAYPIVEAWLDKKTGNLLKIQQFALSGKLMRTTYYPKWKRKYSESKGEPVYYPKEIRIFDEVQKGNRTTVVIKNIDFNPLDKNMFTKAWLESKTR